jgi:hypothetical protein
VVPIPEKAAAVLKRVNAAMAGPHPHAERHPASRIGFLSTALREGVFGGLTRPVRDEARPPVLFSR